MLNAMWKCHHYKWLMPFFNKLRLTLIIHLLNRHCCVWKKQWKSAYPLSSEPMADLFLKQKFYYLYILVHIFFEMRGCRCVCNSQPALNSTQPIWQAQLGLGSIPLYSTPTIWQAKAAQGPAPRTRPIWHSQISEHKYTYLIFYLLYTICHKFWQRCSNLKQCIYCHWLNRLEHKWWYRWLFKNKSEQYPLILHLQILASSYKWSKLHILFQALTYSAPRDTLDDCLQLLSS